MKKRLLMDSRWLVLALSGFCLIVFWSFLINQVATVRSSYLDIARRDTANIVLALAEHTVRTLESLQHLLRLVQQRTVDQQQDIAFVELVAAQGDLPMLSSHVAIYDSQGNLIEGSQPLPLPGGSVAGQDFFRAVADSDGRTIVISKPVQHPETQRWAIPIGIHLSGPDGSFQGAAYLFIQPYYFMEFYNAVDVGPNGSMVLITREGTILARRAKNDQAIGKSFPAARLFSEVKQAPRGT